MTIYYAKNERWNVIRVLWSGRDGPAPVDSVDTIERIAQETGDDAREVSMDKLYHLSQQRIIGAKHV